MISVAEADALIAANVSPLPTERCALADCAGRVLAEPIRAERDQPPFDRVTMDGIAVRYAEGRRTFDVAGTQFAGEAPGTLDDPRQAIEIMTGAVLPPGADTVIPVERYRQSGSGPARIELDDGYTPAAGQFIHRRGSDHTRGTTLLAPGLRLGGAEIAVLASAGRAEVEVFAAPRVAIVATGDELVPAGKPIADHQVRLSNAPAMRALLAGAGFASVSEHHVPDARDVLRVRLTELLGDHEVLVLSGGVSRGKADYVPEVLAELGVAQRFHRVTQRPGKPLWFGTGPHGQLVFGLPGNPVSTLIGCQRYVVPAMAAASGQVARAMPRLPLAANWTFRPALTAFVPVRLVDGENGVAAQPVVTNTSGDFSALAGTDGFAELPADRDNFAAGEPFPFYAWSAR